jgi:uncharacterized membrane protein YphA (DoxX/SURF4 family)
MAEAVATPTSRTEVTEKSLSVGFTVYGLVGYLGGLVLGAVFLLAAWAKAIHPTAFVEEVASRGLAFGPLGLTAGVVAFLALALEAGLGTLLVLGVRRLWVLVPAALLVAFFLFLTGQDYYRFRAGIEVEGAACGCFGNLVQRSPAEAFWQDLLLLVPALALAFVGRPRPGRDGARTVPPVRTAIGALAAAGVVVLAWKAPELPLDDWATRLRPGVEVAALCAGEGRERICLDTLIEGLGEGERLVVLTRLDEEFGERVERINRYLDAAYLGAAQGAPPIEVVTTAGPEERQRFYWQWGPGFDAVQAPEALVAPLHRRLPRSFLVRDGEVVETWDGLPPFERWTPNLDDQLASTGETR